ncbi:MAG: CHRD domain-containing protein [Caldilineaceae bacterium]|nr:CHRD domain-containing protein [Caldilineaceae bacterium]
MHIRQSVLAVIFLSFAGFVISCTAESQVRSPTSQAQASTVVQSERATTNNSTQAELMVADLPVILDPARGAEIGEIYEAFLSPHQEPNEEANTPALTPQQFRSTAPSLLRSERTSRGHAIVRFTKDLSKAYVDVRVENVKAEDVVMFHIHCGRPDMLGPILIDFAHSGDLQEELADGLWSVVVTNEDIEMVSASGHGLIGAFTAGCPVVPGIPGDVKTIAGMAHIARQGELYFNLHTSGQVFYGDIRGQMLPLSKMDD